MVKIGKPIESLLGGATAVAASPEEPEFKPTITWRGANSGAEGKEEMAAEEELEIAASVARQRWGRSPAAGPWR